MEHAPMRHRRAAAIAAIVSGAVVIAVVAAFLLWPRGEVADGRPTSTPSTTVDPTPVPSPTPSDTGYPVNTRTYDTDALPVVDVFAVNPDLPLDDDPSGELTTLTAQPTAAGAPVFADPTGEPVAFLPHEQQYGGTVVPVVEHGGSWVKVLLVGRQAVPSQGDPGQLMGWLRVQDVDLQENGLSVDVDLTARTIDIVSSDGVERVADDFGSGVDATPTPTGRAFVMFQDVVESLAYTRGHPIVYLSTQSPTMDGYDGQTVAVTAFHYHDVHSGIVSNGCLRLDEQAIARIAELPVGTPVSVHA